MTTDHAARRLRLGTIAGMLLLHALALLDWAGTWITGSVEGTPLAVGGSVAAPAVPALALCGLALAAALSIAGPVFRAVLGVLQVLLGGSIALSGALVLASPVSAAAPAVTARTGVSGTDGVAELLSSAAVTPLPVLALVLGCASAALGVLLLGTSRRWPDRSNRFTAVRAEAADGSGPFPGGSIDEWDALTGGADPTTPQRDRRDGLDGDRGTAR